MYYIIEFDRRPDGIVNTSTTARSSFAGGVSLYHDRYSKLVVDTNYVSAAIMLVDENLTVIEQAQVQTSYAAPTEE